MDHLSSCYFCGAALDEPLGAYTVGTADGEPSVTLCAGCRHKLDRLLDANGIEETVPAEPEAETDEAGGAAETADDEDVTAESSVGETDPTELVTEADSDGEQPEPELSIKTIDAETADEPADAEESEWTPDPEAWGERDEDARRRPRANLSTEPVTTNPEELPDDEEIKEIPGLAVNDDDSPSGGWETDIQEEMQPDVPDAFADPAADSDGETDSSEAEIENIEDQSDTAEAGTPAQPSDEGETEPADGDEPIATDTEGDAGEAGVDDVADGSELEAETDESGIDPSILQADEIATGNADIEEVLDGEIEIPDELAGATEDEGDGDRDPSPAEPGTNGEEPVDPEPSENPSEPDTGADEPGTAASINPAGEEGSDDPTGNAGEPEAGDGGFDFESDPGSPPEDEEELQSEMEPDVPEQFRNDSETAADEPTNSQDIEAVDAADEPLAEGTDPDATDDGADSTAAVEELSGADPRGEDVADEADFSGEPAVGIEDATEPKDMGAEPPESGAHPTSEAGDEGERRRSVSALEYNKVMRLLQNREFPVDRTELIAVAASTDDLTEADCAAALDIAVDRGLLAEDGTRLVKPD